MSKNEWVKYRNGNYYVYFNKKNGTKIRRCMEDEMKPDFPENCDVLISTKCKRNCPWCYAGCSPEGVHGNFENLDFIDTIHEYTELALNLNFPLHPGLVSFLRKMKEKKVFVNLTVSQPDFIQNREFIESLYNENLFFGLGVSASDNIRHLVYSVSHTCIKNIVIHVINGLFMLDNFEDVEGKGLKLLILGYKEFGNGIIYEEKERVLLEKRKRWMKENISRLLQSFEIVSFDNLALEQLDIRSMMSDDEWEKYYMGDDGTATIAINIVNRTFSKNSTSVEEYPIDGKSLHDMLSCIRSCSALGS